MSESNGPYRAVQSYSCKAWFVTDTPAELSKSWRFICSKYFETREDAEKRASEMNSECRGTGQTSPEPESRSIQRRKALQRGEPMPKFTDRSIEIAELRAAIDEVGRMPHVLPCSVYISCRYDVGAPSKCDCYKSKRLAILRAQLAQLENKAEEKP